MLAAEAGRRLVGGLSLRQLSYLVALAESLHFTRAAERCFVTQSTLSAGIRELEQHLGTTLFERDRQSVRLTPIGSELSARARSLLSQAQDLVQAARDAPQPLEGRLALGAIPTIAPFLLPPLLRRMRHEMPRLQVTLREEQTARLIEELQAGELDAALIALPVETGPLQLQVLFDEELWLIAAQGDPLVRELAPRVSEIDLERLVLLAEGHCLRQHSLEACQRGRRGRARQASLIEATSLPTLVQMVEAGLGISLLPEMAVKAGMLVGTQVVARPLAAPAPRRRIALASRRTSARGQLLERIGELVEEGRRQPVAGARRSRLRPRAA